MVSRGRHADAHGREPPARGVEDLDAVDAHPITGPGSDVATGTSVGARLAALHVEGHGEHLWRAVVHRDFDLRVVAAVVQPEPRRARPQCVEADRPVTVLRQERVATTGEPDVAQRIHDPHEWRGQDAQHARIRTGTQHGDDPVARVDDAQARDLDLVLVAGVEPQRPGGARTAKDVRDLRPRRAVHPIVDHEARIRRHTGQPEIDRAAAGRPHRHEAVLALPVETQQRRLEERLVRLGGRRPQHPGEQHGEQDDHGARHVTAGAAGEAMAGASLHSAELHAARPRCHVFLIEILVMISTTRRTRGAPWPSLTAWRCPHSGGRPVRRGHLCDEGRPALVASAASPARNCRHVRVRDSADEGQVLPR